MPTSTCVRSPALPQEIFDMIIDQFHSDYPDLKSCSLVNYKWLRRSYYHLFGRLNLRTDRLNDLASFLAVLKRPGSLVAPAIRCLHVVWIRARQDGDGFSSSTHDDPRMPPSQSWEMRALVDLVEVLPRLERLSLDELDMSELSAFLTALRCSPLVQASTANDNSLINLSLDAGHYLGASDHPSLSMGSHVTPLTSPHAGSQLQRLLPLSLTDLYIHNLELLPDPTPLYFIAIHHFCTSMTVLHTVRISGWGFRYSGEDWEAAISRVAGVLRTGLSDHVSLVLTPPVESRSTGIW